MNALRNYFKQRFIEINNSKLFSCVLAFLLCLTVVVSYHVMMVQTVSNIAFLDVNKIVHDFSYNLSQNKNLNGNQKTMMTKEFSNLFKTYIDFYAHENKVIIINKDAILSGEDGDNKYKNFMKYKDITPIIENNMQIYMINYFDKNIEKESLGNI